MQRRITALLLILIFAVVSFQGCSSKKAQEDTNNNEQTQSKENKGTKESKEEVKETAALMGRYMEKNVELPELKENENVLKILKGANNSIELYTRVKGEFFCYRLAEDMSWESTKPGWLNDGGPKGSNIEIDSICYGADGCYYLCYADYDEEGKSHILKSDDQGETSQPVDIPYLSEKVALGDSKYYPMIRNMDVLENGSLVLSILQEDNNLQVFSTDGEKVGELSAIMPEDRVCFKTVGNDIITEDEDGKKIVFYDAVNNREKNTVDFEMKGNSIRFAMNKEGTTYVVNSGGIHRLVKDGSLWETVVDGALNSMSMPSLYADELIVSEDSEEQFYVSYQDSNGGYKLKHYVYDKNVSSVPSTELTVYSLEENNTVRQAISLFQAQNADIKVNYVVAMGEEGGTVSDYIRALNTELLAGSGADILVLDGLPVDSYLEKGVLADISDVIQPLEEAGTFMSNITGSYEEQGKTYQMPIRFTVPLLVGKQDALSSVASLESIMNYIEKSPEVPFISALPYKYVLQNFLALYSKDLFNNGELSKEKLTEFLQSLKRLADNIRISEDEGDDNGYLDAGDYLIDLHSLFRSPMSDFIDKKVSVLWNQIHDFLSLVIPFSIMKNTDYQYSSINQMFIPEGMVGLNSASKEAEVAKQFIGFLFSEEVQDTNLYDGFPLNNNSMEKWLDKEEEGMWGFSDGGNGKSISGTYPTREEREGFVKLMKELKNPMTINQVITSIIVDETLPFFQGQIEAEQAASAAYSKISTYMAE